MLQAFAAATLLMLSTKISLAQQLPRFDIEATCREAQPLGPEDRDPYQGCASVVDGVRRHRRV
jgi:hypothetical protein